MTDLMKRYCKENSCCHTTISAYGLTMQTPAYVAWLEVQLTWRPVSEKPEEDGMYLAKVRLYEGCEMLTTKIVYFNGEQFPWWDVVSWLPIPPAQEA